jgi:hypothetical protein
MGFIGAVGIVGNAVQTSWLASVLNALIDIPLFAFSWRLARIGVYVNETGLRTIRLFQTRRFYWPEIVGFGLLDRQLTITLSIGVNVGTGLFRGYPGRRMVVWLHPGRFDRMVELLSGMRAARVQAMVAHPVPWPVQQAQPASRQSGRRSTDLFAVEPYAPRPDPFRIAPPPAETTPSPTIAQILVVALPVLAVLAAGVIAVASLGSPGAARSADRTTAVRATPAADGSPGTAFPGDRFTLPATAAGLPRSTNPSLIDDATSAAAVIERGIDGGPGVVGAYQSASDPDDAFLLIGEPERIADARSAVAGVFTDLVDRGDYAIGTKKTYDTGARGGVMICASATENALEIPRPSSICVIGDAGGLIVTMYVSHSGTADAAVTTPLRAAFEQ